MAPGVSTNASLLNSSFPALGCYQVRSDEIPDYGQNGPGAILGAGRFDLVGEVGGMKIALSNSGVEGRDENRK